MGQSSSKSLSPVIKSLKSRLKMSFPWKRPTPNEHEELTITPATPDAIIDLPDPNAIVDLPDLVETSIARLGLTGLDDPALKKVRRWTRSEEDLDILLVHAGRVMREATEKAWEEGKSVKDILNLIEPVRGVVWQVNYMECVRRALLDYVVFDK